MKKLLAVILSTMLLAVLLTGCGKAKDNDKEVDSNVNQQEDVNGNDEKTNETNETDVTDETTDPVKEDVKLDAGTVFNAYDQFDTKSATGENGPWVYSFTSDKGLIFDYLTILEASDTLTPWHPWGGNWTGVGLNKDVSGRVELNTDGLDGIYGAIGFKAPVDGKYAITGSVSNPWGQTADVLHASFQSEDVFTVQPGGAEADPVEFPYTIVELQKDDIIYFFCPSTEADSWVSAYVDIEVIYEPGDGVPVASKSSYDSFKDFDKESASGENGPWLYYVTADEGASFNPCTVLEATDTLTPWHPVEGNWTGVGLNADVADYVELNTDGKGGMSGTLSFKAPEDGSYTITGSLNNPWGQPAELLHIRLNGADLLTVKPGDAASGPVAFEQAGVELKAGEEVFFYCPSTEEGGWVSAYINVVITK